MGQHEIEHKISLGTMLIIGIGIGFLIGVAASIIAINLAICALGGC